MVRLIHDAWYKTARESNMNTETPEMRTFRNINEKFIPVMPVTHAPEEHRLKVDDTVHNSVVARNLTNREIRENPDAIKAMSHEFNRLDNKGTWDLNSVSEWSQVSNQAKAEGKKVHVGRVFGIGTEKGSELPENHPERKLKGRFVFQ